MTSLGMKETFGAPVATPTYQSSDRLVNDSESNALAQEASTLDAKTLYAISEKDVESLLRLAEDLQKEYNDEKRSISRAKTIISMAGIIMVSMLLLVFFADRIFKDILNQVIAAFVVTAISVASAYSMTVLRFTINSSSRRSLREVVELLREIEPTVAMRFNWSVLKRAEFRIRLSRFEIAGSKR